LLPLQWLSVFLAMLMDNELISGRPKELFNKNYYTKLPRATTFSYQTLPKFLNFDMLQLFGIMPKTIDLINNTQPGFFIQPTELEIDYYRNKNTRFQLINVVANIHTFKNKDEDEELAVAYPYSICLIPGQKRGVPDTCPIDLLAKLDIEKVTEKHVYTDMSPFKPVEQGFYSGMWMLANPELKVFTDTIGFVLESYFLPIDIELSEALISGPLDLNETVEEKYKKVRVKKYFTPFIDVRPRKVWGCDSPIELFLVQGLAENGLLPLIQTVVFNDGSIYDNFYQMLHNNTFRKGTEIITEADIYFPNERLAIFCDSNKHHRGKKNKEKDSRIDEQLNHFGIRTLRLKGKEIIENLSKCVDNVVRLL
jgi:hypothetical protein